MAKLFQESARFSTPSSAPVESLIYKLCGIRKRPNSAGLNTPAGLLWFSVCAFLFVYVIQRLQGFCRLNPQAFGAKGWYRPTWTTTPPSALSPTRTGKPTVASRRLSYFVQMVALTVQKTSSPAVGIAAAVAIMQRLLPAIRPTS